MLFRSGEGRIQFYQTDFLHTSAISKVKPLLLSKLSKSDNGIDIPEFKELVGGTKRFRALLTDILVAQKLISLRKETETETRIIITPNGRKQANEGISR